MSNTFVGHEEPRVTHERRETGRILRQQRKNRIGWTGLVASLGIVTASMVYEGNNREVTESGNQPSMWEVPLTNGYAVGGVIAGVLGMMYSISRFDSTRRRPYPGEMYALLPDSHPLCPYR